MSTSKSLLEETLEYWYDVRKGFIREVKLIPQTRFTFRPTLEMRSVAEIVQHALAVSIMTIEELVREDTDFHRATFAQLLSNYAPNITRADTQESLIDLLVEQYKDGEQRLREAGELHMLQLVPKSDGGKGSRLVCLMDAIAHEMYHRGQLTVCERLLGMEPALTRESPRPSLPTMTDRV